MNWLKECNDWTWTKLLLTSAQSNNPVSEKVDKIQSYTANHGSVSGNISKNIQVINSFLETLFKDHSKIHLAANYALLPEWKRFRCLLALSIFDGLGGKEENFIKAISGIECIHTASLIIDDLPCIDNSDLRKWKPSTHTIFNEDIAILTAHTLKDKWIELIDENLFDLNLNLSKETIIRIKRFLNHKISELYIGEELDIKSNKSDDELFECMIKKNCLFEIACVLPWMFLNCSDEIIIKLSKVWQKLSFAYQLLDDLRDVTETVEIAWKPVRADEQKQTFVYRYWEDWGKLKLKEIIEEISQILNEIWLSNVFGSLIGNLILKTLV